MTIIHLSTKPPNVFIIILIHVRYMPSETVTHTFFLYFSSFKKLFSCFFLSFWRSNLSLFSHSHIVCKPLYTIYALFFFLFILFSFCHTMMLCPYHFSWGISAPKSSTLKKNFDIGLKGTNSIIVDYLLKINMDFCFPSCFYMF